MNPILLSTSVFIILEGTHHFSPMLAFGIALGGIMTIVFILWEARRSALSTTTKGEGDE